GVGVSRARLLRRDIAVAPGDPAGGFSRQRPAKDGSRALTAPARIRRADLLEGDRVAALDRRGKRLLIRGESGRALGVHLGMTGQLLLLPPRQRLPGHTHAVWWLEAPSPKGAAGKAPGRPSATSNGAATRHPAAVGVSPGPRLAFR